ncbi:hypothetical protein P7B02_03030 [Caulobacter segnis]|uniref:relaxase/mobilization nuclease domain-containing protein n=1 Tax=Caulobacter segnis TaxID=88688 RepID=UPI00240F59A2|nr:hypothetical protein [Caulobacter segnis]MDG2520503.1 hypothetical protein [Caulobacter segnis]
MTDMTATRGFEDFWRQLRGPTRFTPAMLRSPRFRAHIRDLVSGAPVAGFRVTGAITTIKDLKKHLDYISRDGTLVLHARDHEQVVGRDEIRQRAEDWRDDKFDFFERRSRIAYSMVLSMPAGSSRQAVFDAGLDFAHSHLDRSAFLVAQHDDAPHPHLHVCLRAQADDGSSIQFGPSDLHRLRGAFAEHLKERGVAATDAPRWARGVVEKPLAPSVHLMEREHLDGLAPEPRYVEADINEAFAIVRGDDCAKRPWEQRIRLTQQAVRDRYLQIADDLERLGGDEDRTLADQVRGFVADMPAVLTRRERRVEEARTMEASRSIIERHRGVDMEREL